MSDPMSHVEIEDVLASIRRLVSESGSQGSRASGASEKLVLTAAHRVGDRPPAEAPSSPAANDAGAAAMEGADAAEADLVEAGDPTAAASEESAVAFGEASAPNLEQEVAELEATLREKAEHWQRSDASAEAAAPEMPAEAAEEAALEAALAEPAEDPPTEPETQDTPAEPEAVAEEAILSEEDASEIEEPQEATEAIAEEDEADEAAALEESSDEAPEAAAFEEEAIAEEDDAAEAAALEEAPEEAPGEASEAAAFAEESDEATAFEEASDQAADPAEVPDEAAEAAAWNDAAVEDDAGSEPSAEEHVDPEPVEAATADDWEPAEDASESYFRRASDDVIDAEVTELQPPLEAEVLMFSQAARGASDDREENVAKPDADSLFDENELRALVAEVLREELKGPLGERITRNVRKLVRREIAQALSTLNLD